MAQNKSPGDFTDLYFNFLNWVSVKGIFMFLSLLVTVTGKCFWWGISHLYGKPWGCILQFFVFKHDIHNHYLRLIVLADSRHCADRKACTERFLNTSVWADFESIYPKVSCCVLTVACIQGIEHTLSNWVRFCHFWLETEQKGAVNSKMPSILFSTYCNQRRGFSVSVWVSVCFKVRITWSVENRHQVCTDKAQEALLWLKCL